MSSGSHYLFALSAALVLGLATAAVPQQPFRFPIIDSGFPAEARVEKPFWLDNDRVIFYGIDVSKPRLALETWSDTEANRLGVGRGGFVGGFHIWNVRTGKVEFYRAGIARICVEDGVVSFVRLRTREDEAATAWRGPLTQEKQLASSPEELLAQVPLFEVPCVWPNSLGQRSVRPLRDDFGTLVYGMETREERDRPVLFYPIKGDQAISLPIKRSEFSPSLVRYIPWEGRYLIQESVSSSETQARAWYLERDGKTPFPRIPISGLTSVHYFPIKGGVLVTAVPKLKGRPGYGSSTTYLLKGDTIEELGPVLGFPTVSPDGCRGAFVSAFGAEPNSGPPSGQRVYRPQLDWEAGKPGKQTIRVIEFCG